jgi:release factor glutamine methyltransferase
MTVEKIFRKYFLELDRLDLELIVSDAIGTSREFVLAHPEFTITKNQNKKIDCSIKRRLKNEPLAYILSRKEFYGLSFKVDENTLIPRPETEFLVENIIKSKPKSRIIIDVGTGSGNIIISLAKNIKEKNKFYAIDVSAKTLRVAKYNAKKNKVDKKINFIKSDLLNFFISSAKYKIRDAIIVANLPYLSKEIYSKTQPNVKNFEPKSALYAPQEGLYYYKKLFQQIKFLIDKHSAIRVSCYIEISPEQKPKIFNLIREYFPKSLIKFQKDLAGKWRRVKIEI